MKTIFNKFLIAAAAVLVVLTGCKKNLPQATLVSGTAMLNTTASTLVLDSTGRGTKTALTLSWPAMSEGAQVAVTYTLEIDSVNGNFSKPVTVNLATSVSMTYSMSALNLLALGLGLVPAAPGQLQVRVAADVNQSNGAASTVPTVYSNVVSLTLTPYSTIPPPLYPVPPNLYLVGSATPGGTATGWNNPVPVPSQQFTQIDANTFGMVINLIGGQQFLLLPVNGDWSHKYAVAASTSSPTGGPFVPDAANNMNGPTTSGLYRIIVDFVKGTYTITPASPGDIPTALYIVGDATAGGWADPVPVPSQQFTQVSSGEFKLTIPLLATGSYLFLPVNDNDYTIKYGGASATGGALLENGTVPNSNTPGPGVAGTYTIDVNFFSNTYSVK
jgi:starch-binding outer membrane protein SusE/F